MKKKLAALVLAVVLALGVAGVASAEHGNIGGVGVGGVVTTLEQGTGGPIGGVGTR